MVCELDGEKNVRINSDLDAFVFRNLNLQSELPFINCKFNDFLFDLRFGFQAELIGMHVQVRKDLSL